MTAMLIDMFKFKSKEETSTETNLQEFGRMDFHGVPLRVGGGGDLVPKKERFKNDVITPFDVKLMRDIAIAFDLNLPVLIEGGSDLGKTQAVDRVCAETNREVYFVNCRDIDAEMLIGRMTAVEDTKSGFGWKDGLVLQAIRNGGVLVLDEYNRLKGEARAAFHQVYDAVLRNKGEVVLAENGGEVVPLHPDFRIVMTQNPPDGTFTNREVIDPAELSRVVHLRYPAQLPGEIEEARILGSFGLQAKVSEPESDPLPYQPTLSKEDLAKIPGMSEILLKFVEFHRHLREAIANRQLGADCAQPVHLTFQRDVKRIFTFVSHYYNGDLNDTFARAIDYYFVNRFESEVDRQKVREAARLVECSSGKKSNRLSVVGSDRDLDQIKNILGANFYGPQVCRQFFDTMDIGEVPPLPESITTTFLLSTCPFSDGTKKIAETHSLVFVPSRINNTPLTVEQFSRLGNKRCSALGMKEVLQNTPWFDEPAFKAQSSTGQWLLVYTGGATDGMSRRSEYRKTDVRETILSRAIIAVDGANEYSTRPEFGTKFRASGDAGIYCYLENTGMSVGFGGEGKWNITRKLES